VLKYQQLKRYVMSATTEYEHIMFRAGSLPGQIFDYEPAVYPPIPTKVEYHDDRGISRTYRQELDDDGRLLSITVEGSDTGLYLDRTWTSENTYVDRLSDGRRGHRVLDGDKPGQRIATRSNGLKTSLISLGANNGVLEVMAAEHPSNPGQPLVYKAEIGRDGQPLTEEEWAYYGYYGEAPAAPLNTYVWDYEAGELVSVTKKVRNDIVTFVERYDRDGDILDVKGVYGGGADDDLVRFEQRREYDSSGRVEAIRDRLYVPTSAMHDVRLELSYDD
jgi:hypothetical protein